MPTTSPEIKRHNLLSNFRNLLPLRAHRNALYILAPGGAGKTNALGQIAQEFSNKERWWLPASRNAVDTSEAIVDFFEFRNRSVDGLRRSIANAFGLEYFLNFRNRELELLQARNSQTSPTELFALSKHVEATFFEDFRKASHSRRQYGLLLFDTFEVVAQTRVGQWFLSKFLSSPDTQDFFFAFAGRASIVPPTNTLIHSLESFTDEEFADYIQQRIGEVPNEIQRALTRVTGRIPLLLDMTLVLRTSAFQELASITRRQLEFEVASHLKNIDIDENTPILRMAVLWQRYDPEIAEYLNTTRQEFEQQRTLLSQHPLVSQLGAIIKYRPFEKVLTLHDEVQRILTDLAYADSYEPANIGLREPWFELRKELYNEIVYNWYPKKIDELQKTTEEEMLIQRKVLAAEHLSYAMKDQPNTTGELLYRQYFEEAKRNSDFELGELVGNVLIEHRSSLERSYELLREHTQWLYEPGGQYGAAAMFYQQIAKNYGDPPIRRLASISYLGHSFELLNQNVPLDPHPDVALQDAELEELISQLDNAEDTYKLGREIAKAIGNPAYEASFHNYLGRIHEKIGNWDIALDSYEEAENLEAINPNPVSRAFVGLSLSELEARLGNYELAKLRAQNALDQLLNYKNASPAALAFAYYIVGQVKRYSGDFDGAGRLYADALGFIDENSALRAIYLQGLGTNEYEIGLQIRLSTSPDWERHATTHQTRALVALSDAVVMCRKVEQTQYLSRALRRLGRVFKEVAAIEQKARTVYVDYSFEIEFQGLRDKANGLRLIEEEFWRDLGYRLLPHFQQLSDLQKAQRLFEVAYLEADEREQYDETLDSISEAAQVALDMGKTDEVLRYATEIVDLRSFAYQQEVFSSLFDIIRDHLSFDQGDVEVATEGYCQHGLALAKLGGYARKRLESQVFEIIKRLGSPTLTNLDKRRLSTKLRDCWKSGGIKQLAPKVYFRIKQLVEQVAQL